MSQTGAQRAAEFAARDSYGRLLSLLVRQSRDIAAAEDALADAFVAALAAWPQSGVPRQPEAWLLTAARRKLGHVRRHAGVRDRTRIEVERLYEALTDQSAEPFPDERLKLLFICGHPALEPAIRTPLMMQTVLGIDAARIAAAFITPPSTMSQRLVRAKARIRDSGLRFETPSGDELGPRLDDVLGAIYGAFTIGSDVVDGADVGSAALTEEAIYLTRLLVKLLPDEPEPKGLLALMLHIEARRPARRSVDGRYVPLSEQDHRLWTRDFVIEAEQNLVTAARLGRFGRFQTEAAIQSLYCQAAVSKRLHSQPLVQLYDVLVAQAPTIGALVARAVAHGDNIDPKRGLALLDEIPSDRVSNYQPFWAARLHLALKAGDEAGARAAFDRARTLTRDSAVIDFLRDRVRTAIGGDASSAL